MRHFFSFFLLNVCLNLFSQTPALTQFGQAYQQNFSSFQSLSTLPPGWTCSFNQYLGNWGDGSSGGMRGNASVFGFQHTATTGLVTQKLELINQTGQPIFALEIKYTGRSERNTLVRYPEYEVFVQGQLASALAYSTTSTGPDSLSAIVSGLSIPPGDTIIIEWKSERGGGTGASRQIGLSDVSVSAESFGALIAQDFGAKVGSRSVVNGSHFNLIQMSELSISGSDVELSSITYPLLGSFSSGSIDQFRIKLGNTPNADSATVLATRNSNANLLAVEFSNLNHIMANGQRKFLFLEARMNSSFLNQTIRAKTPLITIDSGNVYIQNHDADFVFMNQISTTEFSRLKPQIYSHENVVFIKSPYQQNAAQWQVFDGSGKKLFEGVVDLQNDKNNSVTLPLSRTASYIFVLTDEQNRITHRFVFSK